MSENYPRPWRMGQRKTHSPLPFSPLPALEELRRAELEPPMLTTEPLVVQEPVSSQIPDQYQPTENDGAQSAHWLFLPLAPRLSIKPLKKETRRLYSSKPYIILLVLLLIVSVSGWGLYTLAVSVLGPLGEFFHPLSGDFNGSIDGRAWNLLLLGSDDDNKFVFPDMLTQVMMVAHIDPLNNRVSLVSIPRDSWVTVPGQQGMYKIDQAFHLGSASRRSFDDGIRAARATIEQDYGIPIDRYAWIGLGGFASVIDTLGGIDIDLTHPIVDDTYPDDTDKNASDPYAFKRLYLAPGPQHLSGEQALEYVRSRHADLIGDIGRTQRQQEVLTALKAKLNNSTILDHFSELLNDLKGQIYTNLSQSEMLSVANFGRNLPANSIQHLTLGPGHGKNNYGTLSQTRDPGPGETQDILRPNCANIQPAINQIFDLGDSQSCQIGEP